MKSYHKIIVAGLLIGMTAGGLAWAEESRGGLYMKLLPVRYTAVKGDASMYRAHHWMTDGYAGGIESLMFDHDFSKDVTMSFEGGFIPDENDADALLTLDSEKYGSFKAGYGSFRKYYDGSGGLFKLFSDNDYKTTTFDPDLKLDIKHYAFEVEPNIGDLGGVSFAYERHTKVGRKSRLTWGAVKDRGNFFTRYIAPSWQDIEEVTDVLALKGNTELGGFKVSGEQRWEFLHESTMREERNISSNGVAADNKIRRQDQKPQADLSSTSLLGEKWLIEDKTFLSLGYRYQKVKNYELENLTEHDANGSPASYSSPKNKMNATADNALGSHTWIGHFLSNPLKSLSLIAKLKTEVIRNRGSSTYPSDTTNPPNGVMNTFDYSDNKHSALRFGENISLRYTGLPKTSLYTEVELEQAKSHLSEERDSIGVESAHDQTNEEVSRETLTHIIKSVFTAGARVVPASYLNWTGQVRYIKGMSDYDDKYEFVSSGSAKSAFFDALGTEANEATTKLTLKPVNWLQNSLRYKYVDRRYEARAEAQDAVKSTMVSHIFTYDIFWQPLDNFLLDVAFSRDQSKTNTAAASLGSRKLPGFVADVNSFLLSASYTPHAKITLTNSVQYSVADNFDDYSDTGIPFGEDYEAYDITSGIQWTPKEDITISPNYSYSSYAANPDTEASDYTAHTVWLDLSCKW